MTRKALWFAVALLPLGALGAPLAQAQTSEGAQEAARTMKCTMDFSLSGWSVIYQTADGHGTVTCANGQTMAVDIDAKGGGLSVGKYELVDGRGKFTHVTSIDDVLGSYATANAHVGVINSGHAAAMTKGPVSLALTGKGKGWDIGAGFESFKISRRK